MKLIIAQIVIKSAGIKLFLYELYKIIGKAAPKAPTQNQYKSIFFSPALHITRQLIATLNPSCFSKRYGFTRIIKIRYIAKNKNEYHWFYLY